MKKVPLIPIRKKKSKYILINQDADGKDSFKIILGIITFVSLMITIIVTTYHFPKYLDSRIDNKINNPEYIHKITSDIRPFLIFDANSTIHNDLGAGKYLKKDIEVIKDSKNPKYLKIVVTPKNHLPYAPLIQSIDNYEYFINVKRGKGNQFIYWLTRLIRVKEAALPRFRLEILK